MAPQSDNDETILDVEWVTPVIIRQIFNENNLANMAKDGQLITSLSRDSHPEVFIKGEPYCTHSQIIYYYTQENELVAVVHQYLRPDGTIGASGLPDPKRLIWNNRILAVRSERDS